MKSSLFAALAGITLLAGCGSGAAPAGNETAKAEGGVVNLYTARHYDSDQALYDRFTRETGIRVNIIEGRPDELVARIRSEGKVKALLVRTLLFE